MKVAIPPGTRGIIVLNINSYAGGSKLWHFEGEPKGDLSAGKWKPTSMNDQVLEVVAVTGIAHLGQIKAGLANAVPLAQGSKINFICKRKLHMQVDGEPWLQFPCEMTIQCTDRYLNAYLFRFFKN